MVSLAITCILLTSIQYVIAIPVLDSTFTPVDLVYECAVKSEVRGKNKTPLLLLHGMGQTKEDWDGTYELLTFKTGRRVCRADLRNQGDSPWDNETSVAAMTEDIIHLLDTIREKTAVLIGHSLGGKVAIHAALNYPERVDSIIIEDITPNSLDPRLVQGITMDIKRIMAMMKLVPEGSDEKQATAIIISILREEMLQRNVTVDEERLAQVKLPLTCKDGKCRWKTNFDLIIRIYENNFDDFWTPSSGIFDGSALFIYGTASKFRVYEEKESIQKLFPKVKFASVEGAGHTIHGFYPQFEEEILKFLD
ncbi:protein ABHD11-like [Uloborus diversus]|uniref:protein ABHD11-like n=1 Tax=Uloborus diversus TaxID=327109 RepID=UPI002409D9A6|nr:protein ABHD11-like [Uloborus diversus]